MLRKRHENYEELLSKYNACVKSLVAAIDTSEVWEDGQIISTATPPKFVSSFYRPCEEGDHIMSIPKAFWDVEAATTC